MKQEWSDWEERSGSRRTVRVTASDIGSERVSIKKEEVERGQKEEGRSGWSVDC
jgi:hypothetical protein